MFVYRLARWMPAVAAVVPRPVFIDERRHVLVVESLAHGRVWPDPTMRVLLSEPSVARGLGALLVEFHRATEHMQMWPSVAPGILGLPESLAYASAGRHAHTQALMQNIVQDLQLSAALRAGAGHYAARCVIHGDLRVENWARDEASEPRALKIFDWELSGSGDPLWDVSSLLAAALFEHVMHDAAQTGLSLDAIAVQARALLHGYFERWPDLAQEPNTVPKLVRYWLARLLHIACEHTDQGAEPERGTARALFETARSLAAHHGYVMEMINAWLPRS
jgi:aminoglycoside phosphotransferase (APT) family kinase protein